MTTKVTPQNFDSIINTFLLELQTATPERAAQIEEVIAILLEEKTARFANS